MTWLTDKNRAAALLAGLFVALLVFQAAAVNTAPAGGVASTGRAIGQTGFAYIGGIRTFAAAVIWNRLEPLFHDYYSGQSVKEMTWALPATNLVQILDPQFLQAYYVGAYSVYEMGAKDEGMRIARLGVKNNPKSGLMRANYAQLLMIDNRRANLKLMLAQAKAGLAKDMYWTNDEDLYEGLVIFRTVFKLNGDTATADALNRRIEDLRASGVQVGDHDHDGDGKQDH